VIRRPPRATLSSSSAASDVYKRQDLSGPRAPSPLVDRPKAALSPMTEQVVCQTASVPSTRVELGADAPAAVPSAHCRALIPADSVVYSAPAEWLVSASGPDCHRRMPLTTST